MLIENSLNSRKNNFDTLRFIAATAVIFSHAYPLTGDIEPQTPFYQSSYGGLGVGIFLTISGFLIAFSWDRSRNAYSFMWNRILRIFPALFIVLIFTTFILGPMVTTLPLKDYFLNSQTFEYLKMGTLYNVQYNLPGVFVDNPYPSAVNGSLWTLEYEFTFYIILMILGCLNLFDKKWVSVLIFSILISLYSFNAYFELQFYTLFGSYLIIFGSFFFIGVLYYLYKDKIILSKKYALIALLILLISTFFGGLNHILFLIFGVYLLMYIALSPDVRLPNMSKYGDFSYGIYIYAFPCQQFLIWMFKGEMTPIVNSVLSFLLTLLLAMFSWHFVEKPSLKLKNLIIPKK